MLLVLAVKEGGGEVAEIPSFGHLGSGQKPVVVAIKRRQLAQQA